MGADTKIEWAHHSLNFWIGCQKVSPACDHCYAESWANRYGYTDLWNGKRHRTSKQTWRAAATWDAKAAFRPAGEPRPRVFVNSLSDFFDNQVDPAWRAEAYDVMSSCKHLDFMLLTKRPQNIEKLNREAHQGRLATYENIWHGTTVESPDQYMRSYHLIKNPAAKHFLSMEPLLAACPDVPLDDIDLVIVGGESGPGARPMHPNWARGVRDQCEDAGVPFFFKQWGEWAPTASVGFGDTPRAETLVFIVGETKGALGTTMPVGIEMRRIGKAAAGRLLDGIEHNGMPT